MNEWTFIQEKVVLAINDWIMASEFSLFGWMNVHSLHTVCMMMITLTHSLTRTISLWWMNHCTPSMATLNQRIMVAMMKWLAQFGHIHKAHPIQSFPLCLCPSIFNQFTIVHIYDSLNNCVFACMVCEKFCFWAIILKPTHVINVSCREKRRKTTHCNILFTIFCSILEFVVPRRSIWNGCALNSKPVMWLKF